MWYHVGVKISFNMLVRNGSPRGLCVLGALYFSLSGPCELLFLLCFIAFHICLNTHPPFTQFASFQSAFSARFMALCYLHHSQQSQGLFIYFTTFQLVPFLLQHIHASHPLFLSSLSIFLSLLHIDFSIDSNGT